MKTGIRMLMYLVGFLGLIGMIGGLNGDFDGLRQNPAMKGLMWLCNAILTAFFHIVWKYPDGAIIFFGVTVIVATELQESGINRLKKDFDEKRQRQIQTGLKKPNRGKGKR